VTGKVGLFFPGRDGKFVISGVEERTSDGENPWLPLETPSCSWPFDLNVIATTRYCVVGHLWWCDVVISIPKYH